MPSPHLVGPELGEELPEVADGEDERGAHGADPQDPECANLRALCRHTLCAFAYAIEGKHGKENMVCRVA